MYATLTYDDVPRCAYKFTGKERDTETGLDYFGARYYGSNMGRFMSPDWSARAEPVPYARLNDPQTLNLYAYLRNNPLNAVDADGHQACKAKKGETCNVTTTQEMPKEDKKNHTITYKQNQTKVVVHKDGSRTVTTTSTTATFSTEKKTAGAFLGATSQTSTKEFRDQPGGAIDWFGRETAGPTQSIGFGEAQQAFSGNLSNYATQAAELSTGGFSYQVKQDFIQHPWKQVGIVLSGASIPVGAVAPIAGAAMSAAGMGAAVADDGLNVKPYE